MEKVMNDKLSKETSNKYSEICEDVAKIVIKYEDDFETVRELEYWLGQALHYTATRKRLSKSKGN